MGQVRFISDLHIGHKNMAIRRGFSDTFCHDEHIIAQWNSIVHKKDVTYILGDLTMEKNNYSFLDRLNGLKWVVVGNHDQPQHAKHLINHVNGIAGMIKYRSKQHGKFWLTHCPIHHMELDMDDARNIHGHIHDGYIIKDKRYINVSAEMIDYKPKTLEELL
jgi:calcineurin-like phosphoesterase family protein